VEKVFKNIPKGKGPLECQERNILKMIRRKWALEAEEKYLGIETGNLS